MKKSRLFFMVFLITLDLAFVLASLSYSPEARLMPIIIGIAAFIVILPIFVNEVYPLRAIEAMDFSMVDELVEKKGGKIGSENQSGEKVVVILAWLIGLFILIFLAGFHIGIILFTLMYLKFRIGTSWPKAILGSGFFGAIIFVVFEMAMKFTMFRGWLFGEIVPAI